MPWRYLDTAADVVPGRLAADVRPGLVRRVITRFDNDNIRVYQSLLDLLNAFNLPSEVRT